MWKIFFLLWKRFFFFSWKQVVFWVDRVFGENELFGKNKFFWWKLFLCVCVKTGFWWKGLFLLVKICIFVKMGFCSWFVLDGLSFENFFFVKTGFYLKRILRWKQFYSKMFFLLVKTTSFFRIVRANSILVFFIVFFWHKHVSDENLFLLLKTGFLVETGFLVKIFFQVKTVFLG